MYNTLQHTATHCNTLQHTATHCNTLQHTTTCCNTQKLKPALTSVFLLTIQHTATPYNTLQHTATSCNTRLLIIYAQKRGTHERGVAGLDPSTWGRSPVVLEVRFRCRALFKVEIQSEIVPVTCITLDFVLFKGGWYLLIMPVGTRFFDVLRIGVFRRSSLL